MNLQLRLLIIPATGSNECVTNAVGTIFGKVFVGTRARPI